MSVAGAEVTPDDLKTFGLAAAAVIVWWQNRKQSKKIDKVNTKTNEVQQTLTVNNGGGHVKDQLDRIEDQQESLSLRMDRQDRNQLRIEKKLNDHLEWSSEMVEQIESRLGKNNG